MQMKKLLFIGSLFTTLVLSADTDCSGAATALEKAVCSDKELSRLDKTLSDIYFKSLISLEAAQGEALSRSQRTWSKETTEACPTLKTSCLKKYYQDRILKIKTTYGGIVEIDPTEENELRGLRNSCRFDDENFSADLVIYAGGAYGGRKTDYQIDQSGHQATQFDVVVNSPDKPVALILGAYEPSIWKIIWTAGTNIEAVVVTGHHKQAIAGLPNDVPIINSTQANHGPCRYMYVSENNIKEVNPFSNEIFGKNVEMVYLAKGGKMLFGKTLAGNTKLYTSKETPPEAFADKTKPFAGEAGLNQLVSEGKIRPSTKNDIDRWARLQEAAYKKTLKERNEELPPVINATKKTFRPAHVFHGYVILKKITIPAGLYGGNAATFFLEKGVPYPDGNLGHSALYDFNTMSCKGAVCGMQ